MRLISSGSTEILPAVVHISFAGELLNNSAPDVIKVRVRTMQFGVHLIIIMGGEMGACYDSCSTDGIIVGALSAVAAMPALIKKQ